MRQKLIVAIGIAFLVMFILAQTTAPSRPKSVACQAMLSGIADYTGIGLNHTNNVTMRLRNTDGTIVNPDATRTTSTDGIDFATLLFHESYIATGKYKAEVIYKGAVIESYNIELKPGASQVLSVICK